MNNLVSLLENAVRQYADNTYRGTRSPSGTYQWVTYRDVNECINNLRAGLFQLGIGSGDAVGIIANNRMEWVIVTLNNIMKTDFKNAKYGVATLCGGLGNGNASLWQKVDK